MDLTSISKGDFNFFTLLWKKGETVVAFTKRSKTSISNSLEPLQGKPRTPYRLTDLRSIAPLVVFRILFGAIMFASIIRFILKGWIEELYIKPKFHFTYYGFGWVKSLGDPGMYIIFTVMAAAAFLVMIGWHYRWAIVTFFITFTYVELIDKTTYLNHYYFVSIISFLLILLPANRFFSVDCLINPSLRSPGVQRWAIDVIKLQLGLVYFFAGLAKLNYDWLVLAMPLRIWLPAHNDFPLLGSLFDEVWVAYAFSWMGAIYDLTIPFLLLYKRTRSMAFLLVLVFHILTVSLFPIGMFPYIMILSTMIFFSDSFHQKFINGLNKILISLTTRKYSHSTSTFTWQSGYAHNVSPLIKATLIAYFSIQLLLPMRFLFYPGKLFWTEQGYRFSWRVMLMEKNGVAFFYIKNPTNGDEWEITNREYLTPLQEKMMASQPDMMLQFAHYLEEHYKKQGITDPEIRVKSFVTLNGRESKPLVDENLDLTKEEESFKHKDWITDSNFIDTER